MACWLAGWILTQNKMLAIFLLFWSANPKQCYQLCYQSFIFCHTLCHCPNKRLGSKCWRHPESHQLHTCTYVCNFRGKWEVSGLPGALYNAPGNWRPPKCSFLTYHFPSFSVPCMLVICNDKQFNCVLEPSARWNHPVYGVQTKIFEIATSWNPRWVLLEPSTLWCKNTEFWNCNAQEPTVGSAGTIHFIV